MNVDPGALIAIALMALVTYACRAGGFWLTGRFALSPRVEAGLTYLPGAVLISLVAPAVLAEGIAGVMAMVATWFAMRWTNNMLLAMAAGVFTVWLTRTLLGA